jgi:mono/diheme cytochrome c family protein
MQSRLFWIILWFLFLSNSGCNEPTVEKNKAPEAQTVFQVGNRLQGWYHGKDHDDHYLDKVQPIFSKRCVTCHGCYEAPCQLNLQSYQGVRRGYDATPIYSMTRLKSMPITQMNEVYPLSKWRELAFLPVVANDDEPESANHAKNWRSSLLKTFIEKGSQYHQPGFPLMGKKLEKLQKDFKDSNNSQCTATPEQFEAHFQAKNPWKVVTVEKYFQETSVNGKPSGAGMPFALPALAPEEMAVLNTWMQNGALGPSETAMKHLQTPKNPEVIEKWEQFFNTGSNQGKQAARYIYEHTYTAYLHFDENPGEYFRIVRVTKMADNSEGEIITNSLINYLKGSPNFPIV